MPIVISTRAKAIAKQKREAASGRTLSTSLATDQDYSYSEVHQASFSHHFCASISIL